MKMFKFMVLLFLTVALAFLSFFWTQKKSELELITNNLKIQVKKQKLDNQILKARNEALKYEVGLLDSEDFLISYEEQARERYGLIKKGETTFFLDSADYEKIPNVKGLDELIASEKKFSEIN